MTSELTALGSEMTAGFAALQSDIEHLRVTTTSESASIRAEMGVRFDALDARIDATTDTLRAEMATGFAHSDATLQTKLNSNLRWMIGTMIASYAVIAAFVGLVR